jgi:hypothetical protein
MDVELFEAFENMILLAQVLKAEYLVKSGYYEFHPHLCHQNQIFFLFYEGARNIPF